MKIAPSVLSADYAHLADQAAEAAAGGADRLHFDLMDGHFVPNLSFGPGVVAGVMASVQLAGEAHLMVENPENYIDPLQRAGVEQLTFHVESTVHLHRALMTARDQGLRTGVALNPSTPVAVVEPVFDLLDQVLVMTVNPGFGGQAFIPQMLDKVRQLRSRAAILSGGSGRLEIGVDGGIDRRTIGQAAAAGADLFVAGSAVFGQEKVQSAVRMLRQEAESVPNDPSLS